MTIDLDRPKADQIEISIFGKGIGECSVVHVGQDRWIVIDSFLDDDGFPVARRYLEHIGVSPEKVQLIILTHWHDDHIRGASDLLGWASESLISYSTVLCHDEFRATIQRIAPVNGTKFQSGVQELIRVAKLLETRQHHKRLAGPQRQLLVANDLRIESLSPSDQDIDLFLNEIAGWHPANDADRVLRKPDRNDTSVAIVFEIAGEWLLFGADLEIRQSLSGWQGVHDLYWAPRGQCRFYKIAHHGSPNGHFVPKWENMLHSDVCAVLTPYGRGSTPRPSNDDIARINAATPNAYAAGECQLRRARRQHNSVERSLAEASIELRRIDEKLGHVRLRSKLSEVGNPWDCELIGQAYHLASV
ncbi:MBL fold metallo-hydrolase [Altererythrobacter sp. MF3-039]|uniref:MBL fold metallo-hydrolase n=1 Tax=Altererythrobacter sp. MF3-039 TaxID=3252901 RepID=UPI00390C409A